MRITPETGFSKRIIAGQNRQAFATAFKGPDGVLKGVLGDTCGLLKHKGIEQPRMVLANTERGAKYSLYACSCVARLNPMGNPMCPE